MHADNGRVDHLHGDIMYSRKGVHNRDPQTRSSPANEAIVAGGVRAEGVGQIAPRRAGSQDSANTAVVHPRYAAGFFRQHWLDCSPLIVSKFVAHPPLAHGLESRL
jgi:hypothetical protein